MKSIHCFIDKNQFLKTMLEMENVCKYGYKWLRLNFHFFIHPSFSVLTPVFKILVRTLRICNMIVSENNDLNSKPSISQVAPHVRGLIHFHENGFLCHNLECWQVNA